MINNYFNLPGIPCENREEVTNDSGFKINKMKCNGLNPNEVYKTLYPSDANPLGQFIQYNNVNIQNTSNTINNQSIEECSKHALKNNDDYFVYNKKENQCLFYNENEVSKKNFNLDGYNLETYRKNNLISQSECGSSDNFISMPKGFFPNVNKIGSYINKMSGENLTKEECYVNCSNNKNCESFIFADGNKSCSFGKGTPNVNDSNNSKVGYTTYVKNADLPKPIIEPNEDLSDYYRKYNKKGRIGDYFCAYSEGENKCLTSYRVGPKGKEVPKNNIKKTKEIPAHTVCLPPYCIPKKNKGNLKGKLKVNNEIEMMCAPGDKECEKNIYSQGLNYQDELGLPSVYSPGNPPNSFPYFENQFKTYQNLIPLTDGLMDAPGVDAFKFKEGCMNWCLKDENCGGFSYKHGMDGSAKCNYYSNVGENKIRESLQYQSEINTQIKRQEPYEQNPPKGLEKKPYFNNQEVPFDLPMQNVCEGFSVKNTVNKVKNTSNSKTPFLTTPVFNVNTKDFTGYYIYLKQEGNSFTFYILSRSCPDNCKKINLDGQELFVILKAEERNQEQTKKFEKFLMEKMGIQDTDLIFISLFYNNIELKPCNIEFFGIIRLNEKDNKYYSSFYFPWFFYDEKQKKILLPKKEESIYYQGVWYYKTVLEKKKDLCSDKGDQFYPNPIETENNIEKPKIKKINTSNLKTTSEMKTPFELTPVFNVEQKNFTGYYVYFDFKNAQSDSDMNFLLLSKNCYDNSPCKTYTIGGETFFVVYDEKLDKNNKEKKEKVDALFKNLYSVFYCNKKFEDCEFFFPFCKYKNNYYISVLFPWIFYDFENKKPLIPKKDDCLYLDNIWYYKIPQKVSDDINKSNEKNNSCKMKPDAFHPPNPYSSTILRYQVPFYELEPYGCCKTWSQDAQQKYSQKMGHNKFWDRTYDDVKKTVFCASDEFCSKMGISNATTIWNNNVNKIAIVSLVKNKRSEDPFALDKYNRKVYLVDIVTESNLPKLKVESQPKATEPNNTEDYGMCPSGNISKTDLAGSNCPLATFQKYQAPFYKLEPYGCCKTWTRNAQQKYSEKIGHNKFWDRTYDDVKVNVFCASDEFCSKMGISDGATIWNDNVDKIAIVSLVKNERSEDPFALDQYNQKLYLVDVVNESTLPEIPKPKESNSINTEDYGMCPFGNIPKTDLAGSNCPMVEGFNLNCKDSTYGCCSDDETAKIDNQGSNCPIINREVCLKSQYGCCPGTIIPKKLVCDCIEDSTTKPVGSDCTSINCGSARMCLNNKCYKTPGCNSEFCKTNKKLFNCELNQNQIGDPYAFSIGVGNKCKNNNECIDGQMCVEGLCREYNKNFVNTINQVENKSINKNSGQELGEYLDTVASCGCNNKDFKVNGTCSEDYEPVCGTDNKTYQNACYLNGQELKHFGSCEQTIETFKNRKSCLIWLFIFIIFILLIFGFTFIKFKN